MPLILTNHARGRMMRDGITEAQVEAVVLEAEYSMPDPVDPKLTLAWRRVPELGGRAVRVVYYTAGADFVIVTVFFDRGARRWLP